VLPSIEARLVVQVSRWDRLKDMAGVMAGFARLTEGRFVDVHLLLVGPDVSGVDDDPEGAHVLAECRTQWQALPEEMRGRVHLISLPMDDIDENAIVVNAIQRHAHVVVQKSLVEGFGLTVTEAMWKRRPVVSTAVGGIQDQITDGRDGLLIADPTDLDAFATALRRLLDDPDLGDRLGATAREHVQAEFLGDRHLGQYVDLFARLAALPDEVHGHASDRVPRDTDDDYSAGAAAMRRDFLKARVGADLHHVAQFSFDPETLPGNIENFTGVAQVPLGIAGPLRIEGEHAWGDFYIPLATTEGTLIASYNRGMRLLTSCGGVRTTVVADLMQRAPVFILPDALEARALGDWINEHFDDIKAAAESTTRTGALVSIGQHAVGPLRYLRFNYTTGDAAGQNMTGKATLAACEWIQDHYRNRPQFILSGAIDTDKKHSQLNMLLTRGKRVVAEVTIPRQALLDLMGVETTTLSWGRQISQVGNFMAASANNGAHAANALAALFIATGQDVANVAESHAGIVYTQLLDNGDYYWSITLPALIVATYGGGTGLATQRECLELLGCYGNGKVGKFAEICAAVVLAGDTSLSSAILAGDWVSSHDELGRNRPGHAEAWPGDGCCRRRSLLLSEDELACSGRREVVLQRLESERRCRVDLEHGADPGRAALVGGPIGVVARQAVEGELVDRVHRRLDARVVEAACRDCLLEQLRRRLRLEVAEREVVVRFLVRLVELDAGRVLHGGGHRRIAPLGADGNDQHVLGHVVLERCRQQGAVPRRRLTHPLRRVGEGGGGPEDLAELDGQGDGEDHFALCVLELVHLRREVLITGLVARLRLDLEPHLGARVLETLQTGLTVHIVLQHGADRLALRPAIGHQVVHPVDRVDLIGLDDREEVRLANPDRILGGGRSDDLVGLQQR